MFSGRTCQTNKRSVATKIAMTAKMPAIASSPRQSAQTAWAISMIADSELQRGFARTA